MSSKASIFWELATGLLPGLLITLLVVGFLWWGQSSRKSDCLKKTCDSGSPVFLYREGACVCMELPK
jgi:hypothetical protein